MTRDALHWILNARLPRALLPADWPLQTGKPLAAHVRLQSGKIAELLPAHTTPDITGAAWDVQGALVLPGLVDTHTHLDKAFTLSRIEHVEPGLLGAIDAMMIDKARWTPEDIHGRASQGITWAYEAGVTYLRSHCDWWDPTTTPTAWPVLQALSQAWQGRVRLEQVALIPLDLFTDRDQAMRLACQVAQTGPHALMGGFVHSTNWDPQALRNLLEAADAHGLDMDLHVDEELYPDAQGLKTIAQTLQDMQYSGRVVCGHTCALAAKPLNEALDILDAVAKAPITLVTLPITNLLLQDARTGHTPRQRGLTLIKEARARGIPLMVSSDNVQDPFCPIGSFDPLEAFGIGVAAAQLTNAFDDWADTLCRGDWLRSSGTVHPLSTGADADFVVLPHSNASAFPSRDHNRVVVRNGLCTHGTPPAHWLQTPVATATV